MKFKQTLFYYGGQRLKKLATYDDVTTVIYNVKRYGDKLNIRPSTVSLQASWLPPTMACCKCGDTDIKYWSDRNKCWQMCDSCLY